MDLETSLEQSISLKTQFDALIKQERVQCSKELDDVKFAIEIGKQQIIKEHIDHVSLLEQQLANLRLKVTRIEGLKEEAIKVNGNIKTTQVDFYQDLSLIQQTHYDIANANGKLVERVTELQNSQSSMTQVKSWEKYYEGFHMDILRLSIKEDCTLQDIIEQWDTFIAYTSKYFQEASTICVKLCDVAEKLTQVCIMPLVQEIGVSSPSQLYMTELNYQRDASSQEIQALEQDDKDEIVNHLIVLTMRDTLLTIFSQQLEKKQRSIENNLIKGNLCIDSLDPHQFTMLINRCILWETKLKEVVASCHQEFEAESKMSFEFPQCLFVFPFLFFFI